MLNKVQKRKGMEQFQYQALRDVLKVEGDRLKEFEQKYIEVKVQTSRYKTISTQYSTESHTEDTHNTMFMGTECLSRRRSQEARYRRESNKRRQDSQDRSYYRRYDR